MQDNSGTLLESNTPRMQSFQSPPPARMIRLCAGSGSTEYWTLEHGSRCVTIKNVTSGEDVLHDHFPATNQRPAVAVMPNTLIIEGMAQTAGILVGRTGDFKEKVILAKNFQGGI